MWLRCTRNKFMTSAIQLKLRVKRETADSISTLKKDICVIKVWLWAKNTSYFRVSACEDGRKGKRPRKKNERKTAENDFELAYFVLSLWKLIAFRSCNANCIPPAGNLRTPKSSALITQAVSSTTFIKGHCLYFKSVIQALPLVYKNKSFLSPRQNHRNLLKLGKALQS